MKEEDFAVQACFISDCKNLSMPGSLWCWDHNTLTGNRSPWPDETKEPPQPEEPSQ